MPFVLSSNDSHPLSKLPAEDLDLVARLVLHSGSLKDLATTYKVSYPTIRARLDRVIERLEALLSGRTPNPLTNLLVSLVEQGEMTPTAARRIRALAERSNHEPNSEAHA